MNQNLACDQCAQASTTELVSHWSGGKVRFLCSSCLETARSLARRGAAIALGVTAALLILVPSVIIAAGLGRILGYTLTVLGLMTGIAGSLVLRARGVELKIKLWALGVMVVGTTVSAAGMILADRFAPPATANLHMINSSSAGSISVFVDGKAVETDIPSVMKEDASATRWVMVSTGKHIIEAKDTSGNVLDSQTTELSPDEYLFAPAHGPKTCFILQIDGYGTEHYKSGSTMLDPALSLWKVTGHVNSWFRANPAEISTRGYGTVMSSVRQVACGNP
jgi:hypothetical protein